MNQLDERQANTKSSCVAEAGGQNVSIHFAKSIRLSSRGAGFVRTCPQKNEAIPRSNPHLDSAGPSKHQVRRWAPRLTGTLNHT